MIKGLADVIYWLGSSLGTLVLWVSYDIYFNDGLSVDFFLFATGITLLLAGWLTRYTLTGHSGIILFSPSN